MLARPRRFHTLAGPGSSRIGVVRGRVGRVGKVR